MQRRIVADPNFGSLLKQLREQRRLSLRRLGQQIHCSHGYLWDLERGMKRPSVAVALLLDSALEAGGKLSALVHEVSADTREHRIPSEGSAEAVEAALEFAPNWRHGLEVAIDLWQGDMQRRDLLQKACF